MLTNIKLCFNDNGSKTKDDVIKSIASKAFELGLVEDENLLAETFVKREEEFSTGIGDGIAIPHAEIEGLKEAFVSVVRVKNIEWESIDNVPVKVAVAIVVPKGGRGDHLKILTELSRKMVNDEFKKIIINAPLKEVVERINEIKIDDSKKEEQQISEGEKYIVGITACPTGIAHTYMAQQAIIDAAKEMGYKVKVETQGAGGLEDALTKKDIMEADAIIISSGIKLDKMERFDGFENKIHKSSLKNTIAKAGEVVSNALIVGEAFNSGDNSALLKATQLSTLSGSEIETKFQTFMGHLMSGIGAMLPVIIVAGLFMGMTAIFNMPYYFDTGQSTWNWDYVSQQSVIMQLMYFVTQMGNFAMQFMYPFFAMFIAYSIAGKMALVPGFIGGGLASGLHNSIWGENANRFVTESPLISWFYPNNPDNIVSSGFIGAMIIAFIVGYSTKYINERIYVTPNWIGIKTLMIIPLLIGLETIFVMEFFINPAFCWVNVAFTEIFGWAGNTAGWAYNLLIGSGMAFDMGGPVNKASLSVSWGMFTPAWEHLLDVYGDGTSYNPVELAAAVKNLETFNLTSQFMGIIVPSMGIGLAAMTGNKISKRTLFTSEEQAAGGTAFFLSTVGISEGGLPFLIKRPTLVWPATITGTCVAVIFAGSMGAVQTLSNTALWGTFFVGTTVMSFPGFNPLWMQIVGYGGAIFIGAITTAAIFIWLMVLDDIKKNKEAKVDTINKIKSSSNVKVSKEQSVKGLGLLRNELLIRMNEIDKDAMSAKFDKMTDAEIAEMKITYNKLKVELYNVSKLWSKAQSVIRSNEVKLMTQNKKLKFYQDAKKDTTKVEAYIKELNDENAYCEKIAKEESVKISAYAQRMTDALERYEVLVNNA